MNIFVLHEDPFIAAQMQCDKHVVKMVLETGQMLSTIQRLHGNLNPRLYKCTHVFHPCTMWAERSQENYKWLVDHFTGLALEYAYRYEKRHKTWDQLHSIVKEVPYDIWDKHRTPFALAMPEEYKTPDPVQSYRNYYLGEKHDILAYTKRDVPDWVERRLYATC